MKKRIFITGGSGFIGSNVVHKLLNKGHEVSTYDSYLSFINNQEYYKKCILIRNKIYKKPTKKYIGDIRDYEKLNKCVKDFKPDVIVHLAGLPMARPLKQFEDQMIPVNMYGTLNVIDVFEKSNATKLIYTSSSMVYGHFKQTPQSENFILEPINSYGACKAAGEYFVKLSKKNWLIIRPTSVYGFTDCANRVSQLLIDAAFLKKEAWVVKGETLDFSYIEDVGDGFVLAILNDKVNNETINISRGQSRSAAEFAEVLKKYFPEFEYTVKDPSVQQVYRGPQDIQKAQNFLGFNPKYSIEQGIEEIINLSKKYKFYNY